MDSIKPQQIAQDLSNMGAYKAKLTSTDILIKGFMSGAYLGFATVLAFLTAIQTDMPWLGALVFPVGFVMIILIGMELVTGNFAIVPMAKWQNQTDSSAMLRNWALAFTGNLIGSVFFGFLYVIVITKAWHSFDNAMIQKIIQIAIEKTLVYKNLGNSGFLVVFVKAVLCNWMVTMGVVMAFTSSSTMGKIAAIWLPIFTFFALGLEHCVVNMFVIPTAMMLNAPITFSEWWIWNQIPATLGNIVGGLVFTGLLLHLVYNKKSATH